jgi:hypothetical protein
MTTRPLRIAPVLLALFPAACGEVPDPAPPGQEDVATTASALTYSAPISARIISIAGPHCCTMSYSDANTAIDIINKAGAASGGGLRFQLYRYEVYPLPVDRRGDLPTWADLEPLWRPMGISQVGADNLTNKMAQSWPGSAGVLSRWLEQYRKRLMPNQVVGWQGTDGGVEMDTSAFFSDRGNFAHEMGHGFNLSHTFSVSLDCDSWDLIYAARGRGVANVYFFSRAACDSFLANGSYTALYRIDGRNEDSHAGLQRSMSGGVITVQHPRCSSCGRDLGFDQPADDGVERYSTGDSQIAGYAKFVDGNPAVNALTYCSYWNDNHTRLTGCPDASLVGRSFYSPSQITRMKVWAADHSWVFDQGNPIAINPPSASCGYLFANEGLNRDNPLYSCDGRFRLYLQADGNLVLSQKASNGQYSIALWKTDPLVAGTDTTDIRLAMQDDGDLVVYDAARTRLWRTVTQGHPGAYLRISDNGDMKVRSADGSSYYWSAGTGGH